MDTKKILIKDFLKNSLKYVYRVNKFKKYYNCSLNDFLLIEFNNRPYQELQEDCRRFLKQNISESKEVAVENALENISAEYDSNTYSTTPIGVIPYSERLLELIFSKFSKIKIIFENLSSLKLLIEILDIRYQDIKLINGLGVSKIQELQNLKQYIVCRENWDYILKTYDICVKEHRFPENLSDEQFSMSLIEKVDIAIKQYANYIKNISLYFPKIKEEYLRINYLFLEKKTLLEAASLINKDRERARQLKILFSDNMYNGTAKYAPHLRFSDELKDEINDFVKTMPLFCSQTKLCELLSCDKYEESIASELLPIEQAPDKIESLGKHAYTNFDQVYYIPKGLNKTYLQKYIDSLYKIFDAEIRSMSLDYAMELLATLDPEFDFSRENVQSLLEQHVWYEKVGENEDVKYQLAYKYIKKDYARLGRLVYEYKKVEISKLNELDKKKRGDIQSTIENSINNAKKQFPWIVSAGQNNYVEYNSEGKSKPLLKSVISKYVEDKKFFSFEDIFNFIKKEGYEIREKSVRAYITKHCAVANEDANKFCHYDFVNEYSSYTWSNRQQSGILNWTINEVRSILMQAENHTKSLKEITTIVKEHAKDKYKIRDIRSLLFDYIGEHEVFNIKSEGRGAVYMSLTSKGLVASEEDWKKIGVRNRKPAYYEIVVSKIVSLLKEAQNCEMRLSELRDMCKDDMDSACFTQFYKIVDNELPEQIEKVEYEGLKYLRFKKEQIRYEPIAIIDNQSEITSGPKYVTSIESKPERSYGQIMEINWNQFLQTLNRETLYYSRFWDIEKISMSQALEVFVNYIQGQSSSRISKHIPRKLLLVWDYNSDIYDRKELLNELAICYEELLRLIHVSNTGERLETNGIYNTYKNIPNINKWALDTEYDKNNIYRRYFRYIQTLRNKIAHGNDTNYNSVEIMQRIAENVSLYVYTIARFLKRV